jgi:hypothetical protein
MRVHFTYPLSDTKHYQGELHVTAQVDGHDVDISQILYSDRNGKESNVTWLLEQWGGNLYDNLCEAAVHHAIPESDYTLEMQES